MEEFFTIDVELTSKVVEKKSRFIANIFPISNVKEAEEKLMQIKKKYHDARHNCFAYRVLENNQVIEKASDDGEPSGTAGAPMLAILQKKNLVQVLVVVTRYFGGVLLGTGGLVKAYTEACLKSVEENKIVKITKGIVIELQLLYPDLESFKYYCKNKDISIVKIQYSDVVICKIELENTIKKEVLEDIETKKINIENYKILSEKYIKKSI